jgi:hypothetical protein
LIVLFAKDDMDCAGHITFSNISRMLAKFIIETGQVTANEVSWKLKTYTGWIITEGFRDVSRWSESCLGP